MSCRRAFRTVFVMRDVEEMSVQETADLLGIPQATVRTRLFRARALLRQALARDLDTATVDVFAFAGERCDRIVSAVLGRLRDHGEDGGTGSQKRSTGGNEGNREEQIDILFSVPSVGSVAPFLRSVASVVSVTSDSRERQAHPLHRISSERLMKLRQKAWHGRPQEDSG